MSLYSIVFTPEEPSAEPEDYVYTIWDLLDDGTLDAETVQVGVRTFFRNFEKGKVHTIKYSVARISGNCQARIGFETIDLSECNSAWTTFGGTRCKDIASSCPAIWVGYDSVRCKLVVEECAPYWSGIGNTRCKLEVCSPNWVGYNNSIACKPNPVEPCDSDWQVYGNTYCEPPVISPCSAYWVIPESVVMCKTLSVNTECDPVWVGIGRTKCSTGTGYVPQPYALLAPTQLPSCVNGEIVSGLNVTLLGVQNADRYRYCFGSFGDPCVFNCGDFDGFLTNNANNTIVLPSPAEGTTTLITIRIYNGLQCDLYLDIPFTIYIPYCPTGGGVQPG